MTVKYSEIESSVSETEMDQAALLEAIDRAITKVAEDEFRRLSTNMSKRDVNDNIYRALDSLGQLAQNTPPDYTSDWVGLFYLTWYQPRQIYHAHHLIQWLNQHRGVTSLVSRDRDSLSVVDFGCGSLAMQFGVAWAMAEVLERQPWSLDVRMYSHDPAGPMIRLGELLWKELQDSLNNSQALRHVKLAMTLMRRNNIVANKPPIIPAPMPGEERWLTALHTVYENNLSTVKANLANTAESFKPDVGMLTCPDYSDVRGRLQQASPFPDHDSQSSLVSNAIPPDEPLSMVTGWRRDLKDQMANAHPFLDQEVPWYRPSFGLIYTRKG